MMISFCFPLSRLCINILVLMCLLRDWSLLPNEAIEQIADLLLAKDVTEYIRFRAVCQSWRRPTADPCNFLNRFRPHNWVLLMDLAGYIIGQHNEFLNISTGNRLRVHVPELRDRDYIVSAVVDGLLLLRHVETGCLFLLNPFTRAMVHLPKFVYQMPYDKFSRYHFITCAVVTSSLTVILCSPTSLIAIAKPGDQCWQFITPEKLFFSSLSFNGCLYAVSTKSITRFESAAKQFVPMVPCEMRSPNSSFLLESDGQMLLVCVHYDFVCDLEDNSISSVKIFKVDPDNRRLVQVKSIGDHALFVGRFRCLSLCTKVFPSIQRNCIYIGTKNLLQANIYNIGNSSFYASQNSRLVLQLVSYCSHETWQKCLSYGSLTTKQTITLPWDGREEKIVKCAVENEYFPSPAALPEIIIPTCAHAAQSFIWQGSCTHGFSSYSSLTARDIGRVGLKRWLTVRELFAVLLNPKCYVDLKVNDILYEPTEGVSLVPNSILVASQEEPSSSFSLLNFSENVAEQETLEISNKPLMERVIKKSEAWIICDVTIISSIPESQQKEFFHLIHIMKSNHAHEIEETTLT
ncbi:hypothetical protein LUZ61_011171 [Rhynchospora tenuis]|uniref:KIB1-4 beta-propeller domain-containing protein n=1 Tax=Rhynchospora tenuis TaxID=198213 RepID=A0AAD6A0I0_9POAL|nr:hypothetical protein LUZ61_023063 [Rhynchospora tenuis]KAJ3707466.1 hypothetical protein LUZ61_011171 [Rhynchospora tenuis]